MRLLSLTTQNNYIEWPILVAGGTCRLTMVHVKGTDYGIFTAAIDETSVGTIDGFAASSANNATQVADIPITAGRHLLRFTLATKAGGSSNYSGAIQAISLLRTGA
jgi:hypothetical protein